MKQVLLIDTQMVLKEKTNDAGIEIIHGEI
jgi:hypothetical protein